MQRNSDITKDIKDIFKITMNLLIIYLIGGFIISFVYAKTSPIIYKNKIKEKNMALRKLLPEADSIEKIGSWKIHEKDADYYIAKKNSNTIGYIIESYGKGYSGYIEVLISLNTDMTVKNISILSHTETPGLGDEIVKDYFINQFRGKDVDHLIVQKNETNVYIQAISGATISSRAVTEDAVKNAVMFLKNKLKA